MPFEGSRFDNVPSFEGRSDLPRAQLLHYYPTTGSCLLLPSSGTPFLVHLYQNSISIFRLLVKPAYTIGRQQDDAARLAQDFLFLDTAYSISAVHVIRDASVSHWWMDPFLATPLYRYWTITLACAHKTTYEQCGD